MQELVLLHIEVNLRLVHVFTYIVEDCTCHDDIPGTVWSHVQPLAHQTPEFVFQLAVDLLYCCTGSTVLSARKTFTVLSRYAVTCPLPHGMQPQAGACLYLYCWWLHTPWWYSWHGLVTSAAPGPSSTWICFLIVRLLALLLHGCDCVICEEDNYCPE